jgi:hypothetical protein
MVELTDGHDKNETWFPARVSQIELVDALILNETEGKRDAVAHYDKSGVMFSCYRNATTGGVYILTYPTSTHEEQVSLYSDAGVRAKLDRIVNGSSSYIDIMTQGVRVVEDWRPGRLKLHVDGKWLDARPFEQFAYFDFMLRTKNAGDRVV